MKKLLVAVLALSTMSAFAGNSMIKADGCFTGTCSNLDFDMSGNDVKDAEVKKQNLAFNYAMAFAGNFGAGLTYATQSSTTDGKKAATGSSDNSNTITLSGYWNKDGGWDDSCFAAFHYGMGTTEDGETTDTGWKNTTITLEFGHRYKVGSVMGMNVNWVPSVSYAMDTKAPNADGADDVKSTNLTLNVANMAMTF